MTRETVAAKITRDRTRRRHRYFNVVENRRVHGGRVMQHVLYLEEINSSREQAWRNAPTCDRSQ